MSGSASTIPLDVAGGGGPSSPQLPGADLSKTLGNANAAIQFQGAAQSLQARQRAGQIIAQHPDDLAGAIRAATADPLVAGFAPEIIQHYAGIHSTLTGVLGQQQTQNRSALEAVIKGAAASIADPSTLDANISSQLKNTPPDILNRPGVLDSVKTFKDSLGNAAQSPADFQRRLVAITGATFANPAQLEAIAGQQPRTLSLGNRTVLTGQSLLTGAQSGGASAYGQGAAPTYVGADTYGVGALGPGGAFPQGGGGGVSGGGGGGVGGANGLGGGGGGNGIGGGGGGAVGPGPVGGGLSRSAILARALSQGPQGNPNALAGLPPNPSNGSSNPLLGPLPSDGSYTPVSPPYISPSAAYLAAHPVRTNSSGGQNIQLPDNIQRAGALSQNEFQEDTKQAQAAKQSLANLNAIDADFDKLKNSNSVVQPGAFSDARQALANAINTAAKLTGNKPPVGQDDLASAESIVKSSQNLAFNLTNSNFGGAHVAEGTIGRAFASNPTLESSYLGGKLLVDTLKASNQFLIDQNDYVAQQVSNPRNLGDVTAAKIAFAKANSPSAYLQPVLEKYGLGPGGKFLNAQAVSQAYKSGLLEYDQAADIIRKKDFSSGK